MNTFNFDDDFFSLQEKFIETEKEFIDSLIRVDSDIPQRISNVLKEGDYEKLEMAVRFIMRSLSKVQYGVLIAKIYQSIGNSEEREALVNCFKDLAARW